MIDIRGTEKTGAVKLILEQRKQLKIIKHARGFLFGKHDLKDEIGDLNFEATKVKSFKAIKTYNIIKNAIWGCVLDQHEDDIPKEDKQVDLTLLRELMHEIKVYIEYIKL